MTDTTDPIDPESLPEPPDDSVVGTPTRRPGSVRRTANINMVWPDGPGTEMQLRGRARDLLTPVDGEPVVLAEASMVVGVGQGRTVTSIEVSGDRVADGLVGAQGGSRFRSAVDETLPGERELATPLHFLLDDIAGASLIAGFAWSQAIDPAMRESMAMSPSQMVTAPAPGNIPATPIAPAGPQLRKGRIICSGLRPNGFHDIRRGRGDFGGHALRIAGDLLSDDPWAWHDIEPPPDPGEGACMRRRRRVDVWRGDGTIEVDAHFRDALWRYDGVELSLHEYSVRATVDTTTGTVRDVAATPHVLPFPECPWAAPHVAQVVGLPVETFRTSVQDTLTELECCTHLNDMLRCLAEVEALAGAIA
jgi:hypothetical protein